MKRECAYCGHPIEADALEIRVVKWTDSAIGHPQRSEFYHPGHLPVIPWRGVA
jgi:hypothetical protein